MGQFSNDLPNDLLLENIWPSILKISPCKDQIALFFSLHLSNKAQKQLVNRSESWSNYNVHLAKIQNILRNKIKKWSMKIEVLNPIALMNGWMIMIKNLRAGNVHCVIILEGANFTNSCKTHYKNQETQVGWNLHISTFLGIITVWYLILRTMKSNVSKCVFVQPTM